MCCNYVLCTITESFPDKIIKTGISVTLNCSAVIVRQLLLLACVARAVISSLFSTEWNIRASRAGNSRVLIILTLLMTLSRLGLAIRSSSQKFNKLKDNYKDVWGGGIGRRQ
jgi:hypothetical protein